MEINITTRGVVVTMTGEECKENRAVQQALRIAQICNWKAGGMVRLTGDRYLVKIAKEYRDIFASRVMAELGFRGVAAEVVVVR